MTNNRTNNPWGLKEFTKLRHKGLNNREAIYEYSEQYGQWMLWYEGINGAYERLDNNSLDEWEIIE